MTERSRWGVFVVLVAMALAACTGDEGGQVRDLGSDGSATGTGSATGSGSASASGPASGTGSATAGDGGYEYVTDVSAHRLVVADVCDIKELLDSEPIDFAAIETLYTEGEHSVNEDGSVRSLAGFATAEDRLHGLDDYYGTATPLDHFVSAAISGDGMFGGVSESVRAQAIEKGTQNQILVAWMDHELESALEKAGNGDFDPTSGALHSWDEAWAFYHGAEPGCAPYATANSRAENFGTVGADGETAQANEEILSAFNEGKEALRAEDSAAARAAVARVRRAVFITYSQAAVRYATLTQEDLAGGDTEGAASHQAEGLAFWRVIEAWAAEAGADVAAVNAIFDLGSEPGVNGGGDEVRNALAPAWEALGIDAADIGQLS